MDDIDEFYLINYKNFKCGSLFTINNKIAGCRPYSARAVFLFIAGMLIGLLTLFVIVNFLGNRAQLKKAYTICYIRLTPEDFLVFIKSIATLIYLSIFIVIAYKVNYSRKLENRKYLRKEVVSKLQFLNSLKVEDYTAA